MLKENSEEWRVDAGEVDGLITSCSIAGSRQAGGVIVWVRFLWE
jgi:hypothetical protein